MDLNAKTDGYAASLLWDSNNTMPHFQYSTHNSSEKRGYTRIKLKRVSYQNNYKTYNQQNNWLVIEDIINLTLSLLWEWPVKKRLLHAC